MKVIEFPKGKKKKPGKCNCDYVYRFAYKPEDDTYGAMVGKRVGEEKIKELSFLAGFDEESQAEAAAFGFMEALHYIHAGGEL